VAYIGRPSIVGNFVKLDSITAVNGQAAYTMQNNSVNFTDYSTVNQFLVSLNSVIQSPGSSFTVSGSTLTFASNLSTGDVIDFIIVFGNSLSAGVPTDATVSTAKIVDDAVTAAKINNDIISGSTELASEPADTDEFLVSDAGTLKRIDYSLIKGGGITEADMWNKRDSDQSISGDTTTTVTGWTRVTGTAFDKLGTGLSYNSSDGVFSFPSTGYYLIGCSLTFRDNANNSYMSNQIHTTTNNSSYGVVAMATQFQTADGSTNLFTSAYTQYLLDVTDTANVKFKIRVFGQSAFEVDTDSDRASCFITSVILGDT